LHSPFLHLPYIYKIKLLGIYKKLDNECQQTIYPALVKKCDKISQVDGPFNAVLVNTSNASWNLSIGRGAGGLTTGSAIVADLIDIACGRSSFLFGVENSKLSEANVIDISQRVGKYFLKLIIDKNSAQKTNIAEVIFGNKILVEQAAFIDANEEIICGFLINSQVEKDLTEILKNLDSGLVKSSKFLRVEEIGF
jgi:homoserine dehydrogenase